MKELFTFRSLKGIKAQEWKEKTDLFKLVQEAKNNFLAEYLLMYVFNSKLRFSFPIIMVERGSHLRIAYEGIGEWGRGAGGCCGSGSSPYAGLGP